MGEPSDLSSQLTSEPSHQPKVARARSTEYQYCLVQSYLALNIENGSFLPSNLFSRGCPMKYSMEASLNSSTARKSIYPFKLINYFRVIQRKSNLLLLLSVPVESDPHGRKLMKLQTLFPHRMLPLLVPFPL